MKRRSCSQDTIERGVPAASAAINELYQGLYRRAEFYKCFKGWPMYYGTLHVPDGQRIWALVKGDHVRVMGRDYDGRPSSRVITVTSSMRRRFTW